MEHKCAGDCGSCSGCSSRSLEMTRRELEVLELFSQLPFLPVARRADSETPFCREADDPEALLCLERKGLIDIDYSLSLKGYAYEGYEGYALRGSMALTNRGQAVLEALEVQGTEP